MLLSSIDAERGKFLRVGRGRPSGAPRKEEGLLAESEERIKHSRQS